jgi:hypothetical protein
MPNPAHRMWLVTVCGALATSCAAMDSGPRASPSASGETGVDMRHRILMSSSVGPRLVIEMEPVRSGGGAATLTHDGRVWRVTDANCAAFHTALEEWRAFPPIRPGPLALQDGSPATQIPPGLLHGYGDWTIRTEAAVPGGHAVDITIRDPVGLYALWADRTVRGIMRCPEGG